MSSLEADMRKRSEMRRAGGTAAVIGTRCGCGSRTGLLAGSQACHFGTTTVLRCCTMGEEEGSRTLRRRR